ncbi:MAG TPA: ABC transporter substrate-binding protein [Holophagaceae bacterium]|nr:ABC transporter substrate-binding protein [Holophagaceae bacterium]
MRRLAAISLLTLAACRPHPRPHTVVMAWETFPLSLDPRLGNDQASERLLALTHQGLLRRDAALRLVPDGCLAWRWERPYTELAFDFPAPDQEPPGWFTFTTGAPLRAEDALWSVEALRDPAIRGARASVFQAEVARTWVAGSTLHLALKAPDPGFPANLLRGGLGLVPAGTAGPDAPGSGPYRILATVPEQSILLAARRDHPDFAGRPDPQDLELRRVPDASARLLALEHGSVQLAVANLPPDLAAAAKGVNVWTVPGASEEYVAFRCTDPPLADARVRLALSLALDRDLLVRTLRNGWARPAWTFFPPEAPAGVAAAPPGTPADRRAEAERLLDAAGLPRGADGWRFRLTLLTTPELEARTKALALQDQWRRIGVDLRLATKEFGALYADVAAGRFQAVSLRWTGVTDPSILRRIFLSSARPPGDFNRGGFSDPAVDRLLRAADAAGPPERLADLREAQIRLAESAPYAMLWWPDQIVAAAPGVRVDLNGAGDVSAVWRDNRAP